MKIKMYSAIVLLVITIIFSSSSISAQTYNSNADGYNGGYGQVYQSFGLAQATINMQNNTNLQIQNAILQMAAKRNYSSKTSNNQSVSPKNPEKNAAFFSPVAKSDNLKIIADAVGTNNDERQLFKQLFAETKRGFETEVAASGRKNNLAAAMTFFIATTVTVFNDDPEPSNEATENLFQALTLMYAETPNISSVPDKDKQFLYDTFISFSAIPLTFYVEAKDKNDPEMMKLAKVAAGSLLLDILKINPTEVRFEGNTLKFKNSQTQTQTPQNIAPQTPASNYGIVKFTTNFDDGWIAKPTADFVQLQRSGMEIRLFYVNDEWDKSRQNTVEPNDHYWSKTVLPYFNVNNVEKWSGVEYPVIYFLQADAVDKQTGKKSFVTMKIVYDGGAKVIVTVAPNKTAYQQQFPHPNDLNRMLGYNKFAVAQQDLIGEWTGGGGGAVEYYSVYSGNYAGMSAVSTANDFVFSSNGNYQHTYRSANLNSGSSQFARIDYKGKFSVDDWEIAATNHYNGTTAKFSANLIAVRGGFLLFMIDQRNNVDYTLFKKK